MTHRDRQSRPLSAGQLVYKLANAEVLPADIAGSIREVVSICNRAIHGEDIRQRDAKSVVVVGAVLLRELSFYLSEYTLEPIESVQIAPNLVGEYQNARYRVTTVVPVVDAPFKNVRIVDQEGLDEFLEGYSDYAEFIVEVTRVDSDSEN